MSGLYTTILVGHLSGRDTLVDMNLRAALGEQNITMPRQTFWGKFM